MLRCTRPTRFNVLKRTPQLIERRAPCILNLMTAYKHSYQKGTG
jgi:hypothetical protein